MVRPFGRPQVGSGQGAWLYRRAGVAGDRRPERDPEVAVPRPTGHLPHPSSLRRADLATREPPSLARVRTRRSYLRELWRSLDGGSEPMDTTTIVVLGIIILAVIVIGLVLASRAGRMRGTPKRGQSRSRPG